ncbi:MAG TPA: hypothetical protein VMW05_00265 [Methyloceanibacter sp.]|nr:hypothetical protein [Methyloceanibacter sp.]
MTETPRNGTGPAPEPQDEDFNSDEAIETAALAGAAAIERLVAERNNLRQRVIAQQQELASMRAMNEDLRRRLFAIHQRYVDVAKRVVGQLEQFDGTIREVLQPGAQGAQGANGAAAPRDEKPAAAPKGLAERLAETAPPETPADQPATPQTKT